MNNDTFIAAFVDEMEKLGGYEDAFWAAFSDEMEKQAIAP